MKSAVRCLLPAASLGPETDVQDSETVALNSKNDFSKPGQVGQPGHFLFHLSYSFDQRDRRDRPIHILYGINYFFINHR